MDSTCQMDTIDALNALCDGGGRTPKEFGVKFCDQSWTRAARSAHRSEWTVGSWRAPGGQTHGSICNRVIWLANPLGRRTETLRRFWVAGLKRSDWLTKTHDWNIVKKGNKKRRRKKDYWRPLMVMIVDFNNGTNQKVFREIFLFFSRAKFLSMTSFPPAAMFKPTLS